MKKWIFIGVLFCGLIGGVDGQELGKFSFECVEGDTLFNDPACGWCTPSEEEILWGLKVIQPSTRLKYIRRPYLAETRGDSRFIINYEKDSVLLFDTARVDMSKRTTTQQWVDYINSCPLPPIDTVCCQDSIDLFELVGDTLRISISDEDSIYSVVLDIPPGGGGDVDCCCNDCSFAVFREYFEEVVGDSVVVSVNDGELPGEVDKIWVLREGNKQIESVVEGDTLGDYVVVDSVIRFNYNLDSEDVEVWFMADTMTNNGVDIEREYFLNVYGSRVTPAEPLPSNPLWVRVFVEGEEQYIGYDYQVNGANIDFTYYLQDEDVEVWAISDVDCDLRIFKEWFMDVNGPTVQITGNSGVFPVLKQTIFVFVEGWKMLEGPGGDYEISGDTVTFNWELDSEDVEVWYVVGGVDVGFLGEFINP